MSQSLATHPQAGLSWQLPILGKEQKASGVSQSDLLNSENHAKFSLVKAALGIGVTSTKECFVKFQIHKNVIKDFICWKHFELI